MYTLKAKLKTDFWFWKLHKDLGTLGEGLNQKKREEMWIFTQGRGGGAQIWVIFTPKCPLVRQFVCQQNPSTAWNHHPSSFNILHVTAG